MLFLLFSLAHCCYFLLFIVALFVYLFVVDFSTLSLFSLLLLLVVSHTLFWFSVANKFVVAIVVVVVVACFNYFFGSPNMNFFEHCSAG